MPFKLLLVVAMFASCGCLHGRGEHGDPKLAAEATVTLDQAQATALAARPGEIVKWELEREAGGSGLRYSFDISSSGVPYEVGIDAKDGSVLENVVERD